MSRYKVMVIDNFHYMEEDERYELGTFASMEEAVAACKDVVDGDLEEWAKRGIAATELYGLWVVFGECPFIIAVDVEDQQQEFSACDYAKERSLVLAVQGEDTQR